jgi:hypothetical protein
VERVISVLEYMKSNDINLAILIWAISWNVEDLINHKIVVFERTSLMLSEELPEILCNSPTTFCRHSHESGTSSLERMGSRNRL